MKTDPINQTSVMSRWARFIAVPLAGLALALLMPTVAISQTAPDLGNASGFVVLASSTISDASGSTTLKGDVGLTTGSGTGITGLKDSNVDGTIYSTDGAGPTGTVSNSTLLSSAQSALEAAYADAAGQSATTIATELGGNTLTSDVYTSAAGTFGINGTLTLDAQNNSDAVFIFKMASTLITGSSSNVTLINGAKWTNVFWQVGSSATLGTGSDFKGTILANTSITVSGNANINNGRLLAGAVTSGAVSFDGEASDASLPVVLSEFSAKINGGTVDLSWITSSEVENLGFMIERQELGGEWLEIASFREHENLVGHGNTSAEHQYAYTDSKVIPGKTYSYRLLDVDYSGKAITHNDLVRTITVPESKRIPESFELVGAYPNPFNPLTTIAFNVPETAPVQLTIYNVLGQKIRILQNGEYQPGFYKISWNATDDHGRLVPAGVYFVQISSGQFTRVHKVILLN